MKRLILQAGVLITAIMSLALVNTRPATASPAIQDDLVAQGKYLVSIIGCVDCHTDIDPTTGVPKDGMEFAGGRPFEVPGLGTVYSKNITSDKATGLGDWTDEEIKVSITTGISKDGLHLFPIMPYTIFNNMAEKDLDAIVAYMRTIPAKANVVERRQVLPPEALPKLARRTDIVAPDAADTAERGRYVMTALLTCTDCHTPLDAKTGAPIMDKYLGGGQPLEGPWGIVYAGNITPDQDTGIGKWTDEQILSVLTKGFRPDRRQTVVMPWQVYANLNEQDAKAVIHYLRNDLKPVSNIVPATNLKADFIKYAPEPAPTGPDMNLVIGGIAAVVVIALLAVVFMRRQGATS